MKNELSKRVLLMHILLLLALCGVLLRVLWVSRGEQYQRAAAAQSSYTLSAGTIRGNIYDSRLYPLVNAETETVLAVNPVPAAITALRQNLPPEQFEEIFPLLQSGHPLLIKSSVPVEGDGITTLTLPKRYGKNQLAPHIVGYVDGEGRGVCGIEAGCEDKLTRWGGTVTVRYTVNAWRQATGADPVISDPANRTAGVVLTIDRELQAAVEREASALGRGAVVLMEAETGAIRAMASVPDYEVTDVASALSSTESPLMNRATAAWNVGSVFKICVAAAALENGVEPPEDYCCEGYYRLGDHSYFCHERGGHGTVGLQQALELSWQSLLCGAGAAYRCGGAVANGAAYRLWRQYAAGRGNLLGGGNTSHLGRDHRGRACQSFFWTGEADCHAGTGSGIAGGRGKRWLYGTAFPTGGG